MAKPDEDKSVTLSVPKWAVAAVVASLLGGGGVGALSLSGAASKETPAAISRLEVESIAAKEAREAAAKATDELRKEYAFALAGISAKLDKLEVRLDRMEASFAALREDVAVLKAQRKRP